MYSKPYLAVPQQIALLRARGMAVEDDAKATEYLQRIGYYRLSAYWHPMRLRDPNSGAVLDSFCEGTAFKEATDLYTFDGRLRLIMLDALERLEVSLRTEVALALGKRSSKAHREIQHMDAKFGQTGKNGKPSKHREWLQRLDRKFLHSKDKFAEHFRTKYPGDDMPVWIAVELLDFGPLSHLIEGMKYKDRQEIGLNYGGIDANQLTSWVRSLAFTRNVCAHHSRLWNKPLVSQPSISTQKSHASLHHVLSAPGGNSRLYAVACIAQHMLSYANPRTSWRERFLNHIASFPHSPRLDISAAGFPADLASKPIWT